jgi:hypothetical protein
MARELLHSAMIMSKSDVQRGNKPALGSLDRPASREPLPAESVELAHDLIRMAFAVLDSYRVVMPRVRKGTAVDTLNAAAADYERAIESLTSYLRRMGNTPPVGSDARGSFAKARARLAPLKGDAAVVLLMLANEERMIAALRSALDRDDLRDGLRRCIGTAWREVRGHEDALRALAEELDGG